MQDLQIFIFYFVILTSSKKSEYFPLRFVKKNWKRTYFAGFLLDNKASG